MQSWDIETVQMQGVSLRFSKESCWLQVWAAGLNPEKQVKYCRGTGKDCHGKESTTACLLSSQCTGPASEALPASTGPSCLLLYNKSQQLSPDGNSLFVLGFRGRGMLGAGQAKIECVCTFPPLARLNPCQAGDGCTAEPVYLITTIIN